MHWFSIELKIDDNSGGKLRVCHGGANKNKD